jgi:mannitol-1-phosphate/altronate dehydrogenase
LEERFPNGNLPDTPQRIATDTSQKVGIRFGEIKVILKKCWKKRMLCVMFKKHVKS